jgi:hypothetical protein
VLKDFQQVTNAINANPNIGTPKWPTIVEDCDDIANGWAKFSVPSKSRGLFTSVIGMLDGILIATRSPTKIETKRPNDLRSGHKKWIGFNCQAICNSSLYCFYLFPLSCLEKQTTLRHTEWLSSLSLLSACLRDTFAALAMPLSIQNTFLFPFLVKNCHSRRMPSIFFSAN